MLLSLIMELMMRMIGKKSLSILMLSLPLWHCSLKQHKKLGTCSIEVLLMFLWMKLIIQKPHLGVISWKVLTVQKLHSLLQHHSVTMEEN